ncbi:hypothetical protein QYF36_011207 [Acer negundo]|nr:hypothetical protein QYF36_011207 [Acer negundo]
MNHHHYSKYQFARANLEKNGILAYLQAKSSIIVVLVVVRAGTLRFPIATAPDCTIPNSGTGHIRFCDNNGAVLLHLQLK